MRTENQRETFLKIGHERAINALDHNNGKPLSAEHLQTYLDESINEGLAGHAIAIATLTGSALTRDQLSKLIDRCIYYESFSDAIHALGLLRIDGRRIGSTMNQQAHDTNIRQDPP